MTPTTKILVVIVLLLILFRMIGVAGIFLSIFFSHFIWILLLIAVIYIILRSRNPNG